MRGMRIMCISSLKAQSWRMKSSAFDVAEANVAFDSLKNVPTTQMKGMRRCWHWCCGEVFSEGNCPEKSFLILSRSCVDGKTTQLDVSLGYAHSIHLFFCFIYFYLRSTETDSMKKKNMKTLPIGFKCRCAVVPFVSEHLHRCSRYSCQSADANVFSRGPNLPYVLPKDMLYTPCKIQLFPLQNEGLAVCANLSSTVLCERSHKGLIDRAVSVQSIQVSSGANA